MTHGIYAKITEAVSRKGDFQPVIDVEKLSEEIYLTNDFSGFTREELAKRWIKAMLAVELNSQGWASLVKGNKKYINVDKCTNIHYLKHLFNDASKMAGSKMEVVKALRKKIKEVSGGQLCFTDTDMNIAEEVSVEELIAMLNKEETGT